MTEEEYVTDEAEEQEHSNTDEEYVNCDEEEGIIPDQEEDKSDLIHHPAIQEDAIEERVEEETVRVVPDTPT